MRRRAWGAGGAEYTIFRKAHRFAHPLTGGRSVATRTCSGWASARVQPEFTVATFVAAPDRPKPQVEDGARITRGRIKISIAPVLDMTTAGADLRRVKYLIGTVLERSSASRW